jgi:hypothetical protein
MALHSDTFYHEILSYLSPFDIINLKNTNKYYNKNITIKHLEKQLISVINNNLYLIFGEELDNFKRVLNSVEGIISGSFILQCFYGEKWDNSDIDIYIPNYKGKHNSNQKKGFQTNPVNNLTKFLVDVIDLYLDHDGPGAKYTYISEDKMQVLSYYKQGENLPYSIELIYIMNKNDQNSVYNFIQDNFDLDICKNMFYIDGNHDKLVLSDINNLVNRKMQMVGYNDIQKSLDRIDKYKGRGFKWDKSNLTVALIENKYNIIYIKKNGFNNKNEQIYDLNNCELINNIVYVNNNQILLKMNSGISFCKCHGVCKLIDFEHYHVNMNNMLIIVD